MMGSVTLVGAGPGDPGLLTVKGEQALLRAEVVVYDRLVSPELLQRIPPEAQRIDVGKESGCHPVPQARINEILLEQAQAGKRVVRLKGGDPFLFGRGGEELAGLAEAGVPFEVVPGVTSALAAPAYAGIPVTHRARAAPSTSKPFSFALASSSLMLTSPTVNVLTTLSVDVKYAIVPSTEAVTSNTAQSTSMSALVFFFM